MTSYDPTLYQKLQQVLQRTPQFENHRSLKAIFVDSRIAHWAGLLPEANSLTQRVTTVIDTLSAKTNAQGENALFLLLHVLKDNTHPNDGLHHELGKLIAALLRQAKAATSGSTASPDGQQPPTAPNVTQTATGNKVGQTVYGDINFN